MRREIQAESVVLWYNNNPVAVLEVVCDTITCIGDVKLYPVLNFSGTCYRSPDGISIHKISSKIKDSLWFALDMSNDIIITPAGNRGYKLVPKNNTAIKSIYIGSCENDDNVYVNVFSHNNEELYIRKYSLFLAAYIIEYASSDCGYNWCRTSIVHADVFNMNIYCNNPRRVVIV